MKRCLTLFLSVVLVSCGAEKPTGEVGDSFPPAAILDLAATPNSEDGLRLTWTASGDDGREGKGRLYRIRSSQNEITDETWDYATIIAPERVPRDEGSAETLEMDGLSAGKWYFALRSADEVPNWSALSNVAIVSLGDSIAPAAVLDLRAKVSNHNEVILQWIATGDNGRDGTAETYDFRSDESPLTEASWLEATPLSLDLSPSPAGRSESATQSFLFDTHRFVALRVIDDAENVSAVSNNVRIDILEDSFPPEAIVDLAISGINGRSVVLSWTSPVDVGDTGQATTYDVRYSRKPLSDEEWNAATRVNGIASPNIPGRRESVAVADLDHRTTYYFGVRAVDASLNIAPLSNVGVAETTSSWPLLVGGSGRSVLKDPSWSPDGCRLVFAADFDGSMDIYIASAEGEDLIRMTNSPEVDDSPRWSPTGEQIAFLSWHDRDAELWTVGVGASSTPRQIVGGGLGERSRPTWSPDGTTIAYTDEPSKGSDEYSRSYIVSSSGGDSKPLLTPLSDVDLFEPAWSPDGEWMAVVSSGGRATGTDLFSFHVTGRRVANLGGKDWSSTKESPFWSANGQEVLFVSNFEGSSVLYRVSALGGPPTPFFNPGFRMERPVVSPSGDRVAVTRTDLEQDQIWICVP